MALPYSYYLDSMQPLPTGSLLDPLVDGRLFPRRLENPRELARLLMERWPGQDTTNTGQ